MNIVQTNQFSRFVKRLSKQQKTELDMVIKAILERPTIGAQKIGDLLGVRVHKFKMNRQQTLIAYVYNKNVITLLHAGSRENFYRDIKVK